jgi:hypothetical protein
MKLRTLEIVLHGAVMRLPFASAEDATRTMEAMRSLIGQRHAFKNGDREHVFAVDSAEGRSFICVDDVQAMSLIDPRRQLLLKAKAALEEGAVYEQAFADKVD